MQALQDDKASSLMRRARDLQLQEMNLDESIPDTTGNHARLNEKQQNKLTHQQDKHPITGEQAPSIQTPDVPIEKGGVLEGEKPELRDTQNSASFHSPLLNSKFQKVFWLSICILFITSNLLALLEISFLSKFAFAFISILAMIATAFQYLQSRNLKSVNQNQKQELLLQLEKLRDRTWELKESEERYRSLAEAFGDMMMHRSADGRVTYVNDIFAKTFDRSPKQFFGRTFDPYFLETIQRSSNDEQANIREVKIETKEGERWFAWLDLPVRDEETGENSLRTMARDITREKQIEIDLRDAHERTEAASHAKSRFLANVSHEMRTPLNGILGMSGLLADTNLTAEQKSYVNAVHTSGTALLTLIEDILDITVVEAGKLELKESDTNPSRLTEDVCELLAARAHAKSISISSYIGKYVPETVMVDGNRLRQVLINLIGNALKFTETGGVHINVQAIEPASQSANTIDLLFEVKDTGPGISEYDQKLIFEEFAQADSESTREHGGAGLGLAISQRIIQEMGGQITLESTPGQGSIFAFKINVPVSNQLNDTDKYFLLENQKVVLLGTTQFERSTIEGYVKDFGGNVKSIPLITALHASDQSLHQEMWDCVIIDQSVAPTFENLQDIKGLSRNNKTRAIVLLEPNNRAALEEYLNVGFDGYLIKPVRRTSFLNVISGKQDFIPENQIIDQESNVENQTELKSGPKRVLLAEDNDINALLARTILEKAGHNVTRACNGAEAISLWREQREADPFHMIFMDLQMPVMDGLDAIQEIRTEEERYTLPSLPIYILTADEKLETREKAKSARVNGFLTKPIDPKSLLQATASN